MKKDEIIVGDIVHLNSGSPDLKVVDVASDKVEVTWMGDLGLERATFYKTSVSKETISSTDQT